MTMLRRLTFLWVILLLLAPSASAHDVRPGYLELKEIDAGVYDMVWKRPVAAARPLDVLPVLPEDCVVRSVAAQINASGDILEVQRADCEASLSGRTIGFAGLASADGDILVRFEAADGSMRTHRATPDAPDVRFVSTSFIQVFQLYFVYGVEHILEGLDHLLFLVCLVLLIPDGRKLILAITFFTLSHSIALLATTAGLIRLDVAPVEAVIALSIVFVAYEILLARRGQVTLTQSHPWTVTFGFGLLHGLGFATALSEIGLPGTAIPLALLAFNLGVEAGQVFIVVLTALAVAALRRAQVFDFTRLVTTYCIGSFAVAWMVERLI